MTAPPWGDGAPPMTVDVLGRIRNTSVPYKHAFIPLFEAVVNSIQSTEERFGDRVGTSGRVEVVIERVPPEPVLPGTVGRPPVPAISSIKIVERIGRIRGVTSTPLRAGRDWAGSSGPHRIILAARWCLPAAERAGCSRS